MAVTSSTATSAEHVGDILGAQGPVFPETVKCEFCDVTFRCDLDISRHLTSDTHIRNRDSFVSTYSLKENNNRVRKEVPKNISQVLQLLRVKNVKDIEYLEDRGYFKITNDTQASLANEVSRCLFKSFISHAAKDLPPEVRQEITRAADIDEEGVASASRQQQPVITPPIANAAAVQKAPEPAPRQPAKPAPTPKATPSTRPSAAPVSVSPQPSPPTTNQQPRQTVAPRPPATTSRPATVVPRASNQQQVPRAGPTAQPRPALTAAPTPTTSSTPSSRPILTLPNNRQPEQPQPRKDFNYQIKLAIIKTEPKE